MELGQYQGKMKIIMHIENMVSSLLVLNFICILMTIINIENESCLVDPNLFLKPNTRARIKRV